MVVGVGGGRQKRKSRCKTSGPERCPLPIPLKTHKLHKVAESCASEPENLRGMLHSLRLIRPISP